MAKFLDKTGLGEVWSKVKTLVSKEKNAILTTVNAYKINGKAISSNPTLTKADVGLSNVTNDAQVKRSEMGKANGVATLDTTGKVPSSQLPAYVDDVLPVTSVVDGPIENNKQSASSPAAIVWDKTNKVFNASNGELINPMYFNNWAENKDKGIPEASVYGTPTTNGITPVTGRIYVVESTNKTYRWSGTDLVEISASLALGTTSSTAFPGNRGLALEQWKNIIAGAGDLLVSSNSAGNTNFTPDASTVAMGVPAINSSTGAKKMVTAPIPAATTSKAGVMTAADKAKLDGIASGANKYVLPAATDSALGGVKTGFTASGKNYPVKLDTNSNMYVNVPWTDTNTTYAPATQTANGLMAAADKKKLDGIYAGATADSALTTADIDEVCV